MSHSPFTIDDVGTITLAPFMAREIARDDVRRQAHEAEAQRTRGVRFGGMEAGAYRARSAAEQRAAAQVAYETVKAFGESARGRLLNALRQLEMSGHHGTADTVRSAYARGFSDPTKPASLAEIACALRALDGAEQFDGAEPVAVAEAVRALADILAERRVEKAA